MRFLLLLLVSLPLLAAGGPRSVTVLTIDGAISPATADYFIRGMKRAEENGSSLVVLKMDTPGGLDTAMRDIIKTIVSAPIPVASWVGPGGARAASAGTYILYASHIAAMAPGTNLGAATPVQIGLGGPQGAAPAQFPSEQGRAKGDAKDAAAAAPKDTMTEKQVHDAVAYIRSLAQLRGRNADWAEKAVREAASLPANEALAAHVIDLMAPDVGALLGQVQGRRLTLPAGEVTVDVAGAQLIPFDPDWRAQLLSVIASPSLALVLMMVGIYGLMFEFANPGYLLPGVIGGICLFLALFAFQMVPFSYTGLGLIALGIGFLAAEAFVPMSGTLAAGGILSFIIGAVILLDTDAPGYGVPVAMIVFLAGVTALFVLAVVGIALKARRRSVVTGREAILGSQGQVMVDFEGEGWAQVSGETWRVRSPVALRRGQRVRVVGMEGLTLVVEHESTAGERSTS